MQWVKRINLSTILLVFVFVVVFLATRLPGLGIDAINPDGVNWHYRSEQFVVGLKTGEFVKTFQHYHPGVTLSWIIGGTVEVLRQLFPAERVYSSANFLFFHMFTKTALVFVQLVLSVIAIYVLSKIIEFKKALLVVSLFSLEPFFLGNSRLLHMDILLSLFLFIGLSFGYLAFQKNGWLNLFLSGGFLALAFLTKSIAIGAVLFVSGWWVVSTVLKKDWRNLFLGGGIFLGTFVITTFIFFPALWVEPVQTITEIFSEANRVGIRKGHGQIVFGSYTRNAGVIFYPLVLLMKLSPLVLLGLILATIFGGKSFHPARFRKSFTKFSLLSYLSVFYLGYVLVMMLPTKKLDRYMLPMFCYFSLVAVWGYSKLYAALADKKLVSLLFVSLATVFIVYPFLRIYPYYFTYISPIFGSTENAHRIIAQKPFGIGIPKLKEFIFERYGTYPRLGFFDTKPMGAIYANSRMCDIRYCGSTDFDVMVMGPNEVPLEHFMKGDKKFVYDTAMYINGLEYWKVYVKETK